MMTRLYLVSERAINACSNEHSKGERDFRFSEFDESEVDELTLGYEEVNLPYVEDEEGNIYAYLYDLNEADLEEYNGAVYEWGADPVLVENDETAAWLAHQVATKDCSAITKDDCSEYEWGCYLRSLGLEHYEVDRIYICANYNEEAITFVHECDCCEREDVKYAVLRCTRVEEYVVAEFGSESEARNYVAEQLEGLEDCGDANIDIDKAPYVYYEIYDTALAYEDEPLGDMVYRSYYYWDNIY